MKINSHITSFEQALIIGEQVFEGVQSFTHSGNLINSQNVINEEINLRIPAGNRSFHGL